MIRHLYSSIILLLVTITMLKTTAVRAHDSFSEDLLSEFGSSFYESQQSPTRTDTLDVLIERLTGLELKMDSFFVRMDDLRMQLDSQMIEGVRERQLRISEHDVLHASFDSLLELASASTVRSLGSLVAADLSSLRSEFDSELGDLGKSVQGISAVLSEVDSRLAMYGVDLASSAAEQRRLAAYMQLGGIAGCIVLIGAGFLWWFDRRRTGIIAGHVSQLGPTISGQLQMVLDAVEDSVFKDSVKLRGIMHDAIKQVGNTQRGAQTTVNGDTATSSEPSHILPVSVCNVVNRIERNLNAMGSSVRGYKHLQRCVRDVKKTLLDHNYEMPDLVGEKYDIQMENLDPEFSVDNELAPGEQIVTRVNRPLVLHNGRPVQSAHVLVSIGPQ